MNRATKLLNLLEVGKDTKQTISVDGNKLPIVIIPRNQWPEGKNDPTEYSSEDKVVRVRDDYDYKSDPHGWMRHELMHYLQNIKGVEDDQKPYPQNKIERAAYMHQFKYLQNKGHKDIGSTLDLIGKRHHEKILSKYWNEALRNEQSN